MQLSAAAELVSLPLIFAECAAAVAADAELTNFELVSRNAHRGRTRAMTFGVVFVSTASKFLFVHQLKIALGKQNT